MKELVLKTKIHGTYATVSLADPKATPGDNKDCSLQIRKIINIPNHVKTHKVINLYRQTTDMTAYGKNGQRFEFEFIELGAGKILKG